MIHSFNGLEPGYLTIADRLAGEGFVVIAPQWQTFNRTPGDETVGRLIEDCSALLRERDDVNSDKLGLTGFCVGGRYTMLFLPQMDRTFNAGVAWYGFPYSGGFMNQSRLAEYVSMLNDPPAHHPRDVRRAQQSLGYLPLCRRAECHRQILRAEGLPGRAAWLHQKLLYLCIFSFVSVRSVSLWRKRR